MITEAYTQACTCMDTFAGDLLTCPVHGAAFAPLTVGRITPGHTGPRPPPFAGNSPGYPGQAAPAAHSTDYLRGFAAGVDAVTRLMGVK